MTGAWKGKPKRFFVDSKSVEIAKNGTNIILRKTNFKIPPTLVHFDAFWTRVGRDLKKNGWI